MVIGIPRFATVLLAATLVIVPARSDAIAPVLLIMLRQIAQDVAKSVLKDALLSSLGGMGCKGIALANALEALDLRRSLGGGGGVGAIAGLGRGLPQMPPGMAGVSGIPGMPSMPSMPSMAGLGGLGGMGAMAGMGAVGAGAMTPEMAAKMSALMPGLGQMPSGAGLGPDQMAMMARIQQAMGEPLSPAETVATIDELADLGFLPKPMQTELKECMVVLPTSIGALGIGMGMLRPIIPQLREAREQLRALSPAEQDEVTEALVQELAPLPPGQRAEFLQALDGGFFPERIASGVRARIAPS
jgi:hypothetical protein